MSYSLLELADSISEEQNDGLSDVPSDPARADNLTEFTGAVWNQYGGEYDASSIRDLASFVSDKWDHLGYNALEGCLEAFEDEEGDPGFLQDYREESNYRD